MRRAVHAVTAAWSQITARPARIVATVVAIAIGTGFASAALVFTATYQADLAARVSAQYSGADVVVTPWSDTPAAELAASIDTVPGVAAAQPLYSSAVRYAAESSHGYLHLDVRADRQRLQWADLVDGSWPDRAAEIAVGRDTAIAANLPIGSRLSVTGPEGTALPVTVVGVVDASSAPLTGGLQIAFALPATFAALGVDYAPTIGVLADPGADVARLAVAIDAQLGNDGEALTRNEQAQTDIAALTGQTTALTTVLLGFAGIALLVAGIVIANTFTILLAQRRRQIALLRCVGATGAQVRREVVLEAGLIGVLGSALGSAAGIGVGALAASATGLDAGGLSVPTLPLVIAVLVGVAVTVTAAVLPASRAMRVPPLAALRPVSEPAVARRAGRLRAGIGIALVLLGGLLLGAGAIGGSLLIALPGGALSAVGVLLLTRSLLPPLLRLVGGIGRAAGIPGRLAAVNVVRNPGRAAATSAALVVGVALIVMLQVAAASVGASVDKAMADRYPVDVTVAGTGSTVPAAVVAGVRAVPGLSGVVAVPGAPATVTLPGGAALPDGALGSGTLGSGALGSGDEASGGEASGDAATVIGVSAPARQVLRGGLDALDGSTVGPATVLVPSWWVSAGYVHVGDELSLTIGGTTERFTVAVGRLTEAGPAGGALVTTAAALHRLTRDASTVAVWAALADDADLSQVSSTLNTLVAAHPDLSVTGSAADRASLQSVLGTVTTVATGLLAVAVVIAIVGIGNTIGLSVAERTRESALLRALGLRRGQLRLTLALEALLLGLVGAVVGVALGLVYGWAGAASTFTQIGRTLVLQVPWGTVGVVLLVAVAAGVLASVLPARRAARAAPVQALADE